MKETPLSRRRFLKTSALFGVAAPWLVPGSALGRDGTVAPSNRITLGFAGVGCVNLGHLHGYLGLDDVQVIALSDPDQWRRENGLRILESAYAPRKESGQYKGCDLYHGFHEMLDRPDLDAVHMATGENWHGIGTVMCAKAGKHIYVEKPSAYSIGEALAAIEAVRRYGVVAQVGYQQRSTINFQFVCDLVRKGGLGKIQTVYVLGDNPSVDIELPEEPTPPTLDWDLWLGPSPVRPFSHRLHYLGNPLNVVPWHFCREIGLGGLGSNGSHAFDVVHWALGLDTSGPLEIIPRGRHAPYLTYKYPNDVTLQVIHGRLDPNVHEIPEGFDPVTVLKHFGAVFIGEEGWIHVGRVGYVQAYPAEIARDRPSRFERSTPHIRDWIDSIKQRKRPACDIDVGNHSTIVSILGNIAYWLDRPLKWDPVKNEFPGDEEANRLRNRVMREPWTI